LKKEKRKKYKFKIKTLLIKIINNITITENELLSKSLNLAHHIKIIILQKSDDITLINGSSLNVYILYIIIKQIILDVIVMI